LVSTEHPVARYALMRRLGMGGQGTVWWALDRSTGDQVAVKVRDGVDLLEAALLMGLRHPAIPRCHTAWVTAGQTWMVMDYLQGPTLEAWCQQRGGRLPWSEVCSLGQQVAYALRLLHGRAMAHLDLKPENLLLTEIQPWGTGFRGEVKLIDFGLAKPYVMRERQSFGTPGYSAPERWRGAITPQADIYSLGVTLHELLSGMRPQESGFQWMPLPLEVPGQFQALLASMTEARPEFRPSATQVDQALGYLLNQEVTCRSLPPSIRQGAPRVADPLATQPAH
jgi:serine/threonine protein kinase